MTDQPSVLYSDSSFRFVSINSEHCIVHIEGNMPHYSAFHLVLHCLPMYPFGVTSIPTAKKDLAYSAVVQQKTNPAVLPTRKTIPGIF